MPIDCEACRRSTARLNMTESLKLSVAGIVAMLAVGCAQPCKSARVLSAHEAELAQCDRLTETRGDHLRCILSVETRYLRRFRELGVDITDDVEKVRDALE